MKKIFWASVAIFLSSQAFADGGSGLGTELAIRFSGGAPDISVQYSRTNPQLSISYQTTISPDEVAQAPSEMEISLVDVSVANPVSEFLDIQPSALASGLYQTTISSMVNYSLQTFTDLGIVFVGQVNGEMIPIYWFPLGELCQQYPQLFHNLDANSDGCP